MPQLPKGKPFSSKHPVVKFGPSKKGPATRNAVTVTVNLVVNADGVLEEPYLGDVTSGDSITWLVLNDGDDEVKLKTKNFKKKNGGQPLEPIEFDDDNVKVRPHRTGKITGVVSHLPVDDEEEVKYDVEVKVRNQTTIYDPDLIIRRPPV